VKQRKNWRIRRIKKKDEAEKRSRKEVYGNKPRKRGVNIIQRKKEKKKVLGKKKRKGRHLHPKNQQENAGGNSRERLTAWGKKPEK